jgi:hypothetical protein
VPVLQHLGFPVVLALEVLPVFCAYLLKFLTKESNLLRFGAESHEGDTSSSGNDGERESRFSNHPG